MPLPIKEKYEPDSVNEIFQWPCGVGSKAVYGEVKVEAKFRKDGRKVSLVGALAWNQVIPTSCVRCTHLRRLVCGQCVNISCGNYGMLLTKRGWQLIRSGVFTKNVSPCAMCKSVVPLDNSAFDPTLRGGRGGAKKVATILGMLSDIEHLQWLLQIPLLRTRTKKLRHTLRLLAKLKSHIQLKYSMHSLTKVFLWTSLLIHLRFLTERTATSLSQLGQIPNAKILLTKHLYHNEPWIPPH